MENRKQQQITISMSYPKSDLVREANFNLNKPMSPEEVLIQRVKNQLTSKLRGYKYNITEQTVDVDIESDEYKIHCQITAEMTDDEFQNIFIYKEK